VGQWSLAERGQIFIHACVDPLPGVNAGLALPSFFRTLLVAVSFRLVTDANVINRYPGIQYTPHDAVPFYAMCPTACVASTTYNVYLSRNGPETPQLFGNYYTARLTGPEELGSGGGLSTYISLLQATDQVSACRFWVRRWASPEIDGE